jgi:hypothetical protein
MSPDARVHLCVRSRLFSSRPLLSQFIQALDGLAPPELKFKDFARSLYAALRSSTPDARNEAKQLYLKFFEDVLSPRRDKVGPHIGMYVFHIRSGGPARELASHRLFDCCWFVVRIASSRSPMPRP